MSCWFAFRLMVWLICFSLIGLFQLGSNHWKIRALLRKAAAVNGTEDRDRQRRSVTARTSRGFSTWAAHHTTGKTRFRRWFVVYLGVLPASTFIYWNELQWSGWCSPKVAARNRSSRHIVIERVNKRRHRVKISSREKWENVGKVFHIKAQICGY